MQELSSTKLEKIMYLNCHFSTAQVKFVVKLNYHLLCLLSYNQLITFVGKYLNYRIQNSLMHITQITIHHKNSRAYPIHLIKRRKMFSIYFTILHDI